MRFYDEQTALDLEFDQVRILLQNYCDNPTNKERFEKLRPYSNLAQASKTIDASAELLDIRRKSLSFPRLEFEELASEIKVLNISSSILQLEGIARIRMASILVNELITFFKAQTLTYEKLNALLDSVFFTKEIIEAIDAVLDKRMKVKDDASEALFAIRVRIKQVKKQVNRNFDRAVKKARANGFMGDIQENVIDNRRVMSIVSSFKRKVEGQILGSSKTGSLTYIEPHENKALNAELDQLYDDEHKEILRIFKLLSDELRKHVQLITNYQNVLLSFENILARVKLAERIKANKPQINHKERRCFLHEAFHPLLYLKNQELGLRTFPQSFKLDPEQRFLVISGPNAGGKSITLKTMGLLQLMFQSGLLIPASPKSEFCWFDYILSDIGDNQSIENQLSTYSYRLQRMKFFLNKLGSNTLVLLDEFGTGSDPELGGALAEVFFEHIYQKGTYGIITSHYNNIKLRASKLKEAVNANMSFNKKSLEPEYHLEIGQPGSSFTFEVAQMNGIPPALIEQAKGKLNQKKVELDELIANLQKDKAELHKLKQKLVLERQITAAEKHRYEDKQQQYERRLSSQQNTIEANNQFLIYGKKLDGWIKEFVKLSKKKKPELIEELRKFLLMEESKIKAQRIKKREKAKKAQENKGNKSKKAGSKKEPITLEIGDSVRLMSSRQVGQVLEIDGDQLTVAFGNFKTKVNRNRLAKVEGKSKKGK